MARHIKEDEQLLLPRSEGARASPDISSSTAGDLLVAYLADLGVEYVFGIPGGAIEPFYDALARSQRNGGPAPIVARHEAGAAFMAHGYHQNSGRLAVCCATTGPGTTNLITGVSSAYENNVPMLVITAQTSLANFGRKALQESSDTGVNTVGMFQFCTGYNTLVSHINQFEQKLITAVMTAVSRCCPVNLSIPLDVLRTPVDGGQPRYDLASLARSPHAQDEASVDQLCEQLERAEQIVFVLGGACHEAAAVILRLAYSLRARIVTTPDGKGIISPYHPLYRGVIGFAGHDSAEQTLLDPEVDTVVAVGTSLGEWASNGWDSKAVLNDRLIHVEPLESNLTRSPMARLHVRGGVLSIFEKVSDRLSRNTAPEDPIKLKKELEELRWKSMGQVPWQRGEAGKAAVANQNPRELVKPQWLMGYLTRLFPPATRYLADSGNSVAWAIHYLHPFDRRILERRDGEGGAATEGLQQRGGGRRGSSAGLFQAALEFSSMGWAIGAAVGAAIARPKQPVVCITGDGSFLMSGQEITVAVQNKLSVVYVVLNDSALGMVKHGQRLSGAEPVAFKLPQVDFCAMAKGLGVRGFSIRTAQDLLDLSIEDILHNGPTLLDIRIDPEEVPPMGVRVKVLNQ